MKILIDIGHPAHVHYFKHFIASMKNRGHQFIIVAKNRNVTFELLSFYKIKYFPRNDYPKSILGKLLSIPFTDLKIINIAIKTKPDIMLGFSGTHIAHAGKIMGIPSVVFDDTEHARLAHLSYSPFVDIIITPKCFKKDFGKKHVLFDGYMELCYLHPNYFIPDPKIPDCLGLLPNQKFVIMRFIAWSASHDRNNYGLSMGLKRKAISKFSKYARVFISSEDTLPNDLEEYQLKIKPEEMHSVLSHAELFFGESGTMAVEAAILGTPSIHVSTYAKELGNFDELHRKYKLLKFTDCGKKGLDYAIKLIKNPKSKEKWRKRAKILIKDKTDVTDFMVEFIENLDTT